VVTVALFLAEYCITYFYYTYENSSEHFVLYPYQEQYAFIHDAVLESLICGDTQIPASGLVGAIEKLKQRDSETGRTGFETQFHVRSMLLKLLTELTG